MRLRFSTAPETYRRLSISTRTGGYNVTLTGNASDADSTVTTIEWAVGTGIEFDQSGESITVPLDYCGTLTVTVRVTDDDGETVTESIELSTT